jgi:hypothetical protein
MNNTRKKHRSSEQGVALLVAMISLLLISAVAVAMIVASGTEGALNGNYRSSSSTYYAGLAGLEEARGRMLASNPNAIVVNFAAANQVQYIVNPTLAAGETAANVLTNPLYLDTEYDTEFGSGKLAAATKLANIDSIFKNTAIPGPMYKWVRMNPVTEKALNMDVDHDNLPPDQTGMLYYETANTPPSLVVVPAGNVPSSSAYQVTEITALAVLPNGSKKIVQYLVTPQVFNLNFPSALTLAGTVGNFQGANSNPYQVNGNDGSGNPPAIPGCNPNQGAQVGIGVGAGLDTAGTATNLSYVTGQLPRPANYIGNNGPPSIGTPALNSTLSSTAALDQLVLDIKNNADVVMQPYPPPAPTFNNSGTIYNFGASGTGYTWPSDMSPTNPKVVFVDGSFDLGQNTGYGLLVVTGNFHYHGNSGWKGIILVVGDGTTTFDGQGGGNGEFDGAVFVATTRDANGNQLANMGSVNFDISGGGGNGIYYNSCWIKQVNQPPTYKVLSFREIQN